MKNVSGQWLVILLMVSLIVPTLVRAQAGAVDTDVVAGRELSALRGSWEQKTFFNRWSLLFESDNSVIVDGEEASYELGPGTIHVTDDGVTTAYAYTRTGTALTVTLPDGSKRRYVRAGSGPEEQLMEGEYSFYPEGDLPKEWFEFDGIRGFVFHTHEVVPNVNGLSIDSNVTPPPIAVRKSGVYRIEGSDILLTFANGSAAELAVNWRDGDGMISRFDYAGQMFELYRPPVVPQYEPSPVIVVTCPPPIQPPIHDPVCDPSPSWPTVEYYPPVSGGGYSPPQPASPPSSGSSASPRPDHVDAPRDFGSTRPAAERRP